MAASRTGGKSRARRAFVGIAIAAVLLAALLSGAWVYLANRLDETVAGAIDSASARGVAIDCAGREVFGYPFRLGIRCAALNMDAPVTRTRLSAGGLRTAAQIYRPNRVVAELDGPVRLDTANLPPLALEWSLAQASATFWTEGVDHLAFVADTLRIGRAGEGREVVPVAEIVRGETHARRRGADLDIAVSDIGFRLLAAPAAGLPPADLGLDLTVEGAADWLSGAARGRTARELLAGRRTVLRSLKLDMDGAGAELSGDFTANDEGEVSGRFELAVADPAKVAGFVTGLAPELSGIAGSVAGAIGFAGREENGRRVLPLTVRDGAISVGFVPLGRLPALN